MIETLNKISYDIIGCSYKVHSKLGPGLLESTYSICLAHELSKLNYKFEMEKSLPVCYDGIRLDAGYRIDLLVENLIIVELKSVEAILEVHKAQVLTYMKLADKKLGLLINFNVTDLKKGISRFIL